MKVQNALDWLKENNPAYSDIIISNDRLAELPLDDSVNVNTFEYKSNTTHQNDQGPAPDQVDPGDVEGATHSCILLPDQPVNIRQQVQAIVDDVDSDNTNKVTMNRQGTVSIPWPTRGNVPLSEFTTQYFFTLAFPSLFPFGTGDFFVNRPRTVSSMADWADHLLWYEDGRFAHHHYFKFVVHNMIMRRRAIDNSNYIVQQKLGEKHLTISELKEKIQNGDNSIGRKILYFGASLRGTSQYWTERAKELRSLIQFQINEGKGLPSFFTTGSCAEFHFKPLSRLLQMYVQETSGTDIDLTDRTQLFETLQKNTHIIGKYFDLRTKSYFQNVMSPVFGVDAYWYRQEFAKSRGMIHWHGLCWRPDREPHNLLFDAVSQGLSEPECANKLATWAEEKLGMTACHPAGKDPDGNSRKDLWPPPEGTAPAPPEEKNPLIKLLWDVSGSQDSLLEDHLLLTNRFNIHRCSDYCLRTPKSKKHQNEKVCRMEFGTASSPGKTLREQPEIVKDRNGSLRLELERDHPMLVQHSRFHTQGWRANGDISLILSKSNPDNPSVDEILACEKYITGYACKGGEPTGAVADLFNDFVNCADDSTGATPKSLCTRLLMTTVKRDVSAVETAFELSSLPLYRSSHTFQSVSLSGSRVLEIDGNKLTKNTMLDKYTNREQDDICSLYNFISRAGKVPVISGSSTQATWPLDENYCRTMLLLHFPNWRKLSDIKPDDISWTKKFESFLNTDLCPNFVKADVERAKSHKKQNDEDSCPSDNENVDEQEEPDWMDLVRPVPTFHDQLPPDFEYDDGGEDFDWSVPRHVYPKDYGKKWVEDLETISKQDSAELKIPDVDILSMNNDQRFAFDIVMKTVQNHMEKNDQYKPLRMAVSGTAGSGKSYLIQCITKAIRTLYQSNKAVQVVCPTGNSANLISGVTLHSFLKIPTYDKTKDMTPPQGIVGEALQDNCEGLKVLLVDERSLIGVTTLGWMEFMCRYGVNGGDNCDQSWGGLPVVVFLGDDVQLPPVLDYPVYKNKGKYPAALHGELVWQEFKTVVNLKTMVRQGEEEHQLRDVLTALRESKLTPDQAKWLQNFQHHNLKTKYGSELLQRMHSNALFVFPSHEGEWQHNKTKLLEANKKNPITKINSTNKGPHSKQPDSSRAGGLPHTSYLCVGAKVTLTVNTCVQYGLFNGATGTVVDIIYKNGRTNDTLPDVVMVDFPKYTGPSFLEGHPTIVPIFAVERRVDCSCRGCKRIQVPLRLGWATTIHQCQGRTIGEGEIYEYIVIDPGTRAFESRNPGALFVALSRAKSAGGHNKDPDFAWHHSVLVNEDRLCHVVKTETTKARSHEISRLQSLARETETVYSSLSSDSGLCDLILSIVTSSSSEE